MPFEMGPKNIKSQPSLQGVINSIEVSQRSLGQCSSSYPISRPLTTRNAMILDPKTKTLAKISCKKQPVLGMKYYNSDPAACIFLIHFHWKQSAFFAIFEYNPDYTSERN